MFYLKCFQGANKNILFVFWVSVARTKGLVRRQLLGCGLEEILSCAQDGLWENSLPA